MKILHVYKISKPNSYGGVEEFLDNVCENLNHKGVKSDIFCIGKQNKVSRFKNYQIFFNKKNFEILSCPFSLSAVNNFRKLATNYDIINYHFPWPFMDILSFFSNKKFFITYHSDIVRQKLLLVLYFPLLIIFFLKSEKIICTSKEYLKNSLILRLFKKKTVIIPLGIKDTSKESTKNVHNIFKKFALFIGNFRHYKSLNLLLETLPINKLKLIVVGKSNRKNFKDLINRLDIKKQVKFFENIDEKEKNFLLKRSSFVISCSSSKAEAFGISLIEGLMFNKPLVSTRLNTGTTFVNKENVTGYVAQPKSIKDLNTKIMRMIKNNNKFGKLPYLRFKSLFEINSVSNAYMKLYKKFSL